MDDPSTILATTPGRLHQLIAWRSRDGLSRPPSPGKWSPAPILAHLADAEIVGAWRFRSVLAQDGVPLQAYDQNAWADTFKYEEIDPFQSWRLFEANRIALSKRARADPLTEMTSTGQLIPIGTAPMRAKMRAIPTFKVLFNAAIEAC